MLSSASDPDLFSDAYPARITALTEERKAGTKIVGTFCLYVPDEIIYAAGADRMILCGGSNALIPPADEFLPRSLCPLIRSSFGSILTRNDPTTAACPHVALVDLVIGETTCDGKKKMFELLADLVPTHLIDLPQKPDTPGALLYFTSELQKFCRVMEELTGNLVTDEALWKEIRDANRTRRLLMRLFSLRRQNPPSIEGVTVIRMMQRQFQLHPAEFRRRLEALVTRLEALQGTNPERTAKRPRILFSGCPVTAGNMKVPEIIEERGGVIVVEESCTGTRSFWHLVDEDEERDPLVALAERYLQIPCACMTPNDRRIEHILDLVRQYSVDGVVYSTLQNCHGYNTERHRVQQALREVGVPMLAIETDYGDADREQIGVRVDAFLEMIQ
jgi:benzoyl-CoA reductase/2-hydroxyglutaryl-CoA dehydratase subunit BcrC/BadD/HgdB